MAQTILDRLNEEIAYKTIINTALHISPLKSLINRNNEIILEPRKQSSM